MRKGEDIGLEEEVGNYRKTGVKRRVEKKGREDKMRGERREDTGNRRGVWERKETIGDKYNKQPDCSDHFAECTYCK